MKITVKTKSMDVAKGVLDAAMGKPIRAWAVFDSRGRLQWFTIQPSRMLTISRMKDAGGLDTFYLKRHGWSLRRIKIEVIE